MKILFLLIIALTTITIILSNDFNAYAACAAAGPNGTQICETGIPTSSYANPGPQPDPVFLTDSRGNIDNFLTNHPILIRADAWPRYDVKTMDIGINMTSDTGFAFYAKKHLIFEPDTNHMQQVIWQFIPTKAGNYTIEKFSNGVHTSSTFFSVFDSKSSSNSPVPVSPLRQFKWGILKETIQCQTDSVLVFKTKDGSPACVKHDTATKLVTRGWSKVIPMTENTNLNTLSENGCGQFYTAPENQDNKKVPVLLMNSNSTGCTRLTFTIIYNYHDTPWSRIANFPTLGIVGNTNHVTHGDTFSVTPGKDFTNSFQITVMPQTVDLANYPIGSNFTVTYVIKPLTNATGFYDHSIPKLACESYPLAVGYAANQVNYSDFSYIDLLNPPCVSGPYKLTAVEISGMSYKQVELGSHP